MVREVHAWDSRVLPESADTHQRQNTATCTNLAAFNLAHKSPIDELQSSTCTRMRFQQRAHITQQQPETLGLHSTLHPTLRITFARRDARDLNRS
jgi:hypothetical protein